jgi:large subunit ribosomal protein L22
MQYNASHRYARISPRKVRHLATLVRGKFADEALDLLRYQPQRGARMLEQVIKSAVSNAQESSQSADGKPVDIEELMLTDVRIDGGPMFKRIRPRARGMAFTVKRRMSHIAVTVESLEDMSK